MSNLKTFKKWFGFSYPVFLVIVLCIVILSLLIPVYPFEWSDIPLVYLIAKNDAKDLNPVSILKTALPRKINFDYQGLFYFRPVSRLTMAVLFRIFNTHFNFYTLFFDALLFIWLAINIYLIGFLLENRWVGFLSAIIFIFNPHVYLLTTLVANYVIMGAFWYTSAMLLFILFVNEGKKRLFFLAIVLSLLACGTREASFYLIACFIILYFASRYQEVKNRLIFYLLPIFAILLLIAFMHTPFMRLQVHQTEWLRVALARVIPNFREYFSLIFNTISFWGVAIVSVGLILWNRMRYMYFLWSLIAFCPILFYFLVSSGYLFDFYIAISLLIGSSLYALIRNIIERKKGFRFSNISKIVSLILLVFFIFYSFNSVRKFAFGVYHWREVNNRNFKHNIKELIGETKLGETVIVPNGQAYYYRLMARLYERNDLNVLEMDYNKIKGLGILGENLLRPSEFREEIKKWGMQSGITVVQENDGLDAMNNNICINISRNSATLVDKSSDLCIHFPVDEGKNYIFGGEIKASDLSSRIEVITCIPYGKCYTAVIVPSVSLWQSYYAVLRGGMVKNNAFSCIRFNTAKGNICVRNVFLKEMKYRLVGNWQ